MRRLGAGAHPRRAPDERSRFRPDTLHAHIQGQSAPVFAPSRLLGIELKPRMRGLSDTALHRPDRAARYQLIDTLFGPEIDRMLYASLVATAIMLSNVVEMRTVLAAIAEAGGTLTPELVAALGPYRREHIRCFGQYVLDVKTLPEPLDPRALPFAQAL
ncbi:MAG: Tn3 family transposase [Pseudomonadota bacterium]